jgi:hypothetical protein
MVLRCKDNKNDPNEDDGNNAGRKAKEKTFARAHNIPVGD